MKLKNSRLEPRNHFPKRKVKDVARNVGELNWSGGLSESLRLLDQLGDCCQSAQLIAQQHFTAGASDLLYQRG